MPIPFPGMNPYLEHPDLWPTIHQKLIKAIASQLSPQLEPLYQVRISERHYQVSGEDSLVVGSPGLSWRANGREQNGMASHRMSHLDVRQGPTEESVHLGIPIRTNAVGSIPDARTHPMDLDRSRPKRPISVLIPVPQKIYETYLEIVSPTGEVVTVIEALSPKKKRPGRGRSLYERQRETIFGSPTHFVEIDLLRGWDPPSIYGPDESGDYRILISRSEQRPRAELYTWKVTESIPEFNLPLSGSDEMPLSLKPMVDEACDRTDLLVNYQQPPLPPLSFEESLWLEDFLQQVGMRPHAS